MKDMNPFERVCFGCETVVDGGEPTLKCAGACGRRYHAECAPRREDIEAHANAWALPPRAPAPAAKWRCVDCELAAHRCAQCHAYALDEDAVALRAAGGIVLSVCAACAEAAGDAKAPADACAGCAKPLAPADVAWRCVRCPRAYHRGCRPAAAHVLESGDGDLGVGVIKCVTMGAPHDDDDDDSYYYYYCDY